MNFGDMKYLASLIVPVSCFFGLYLGGWAAPGVLYIGFVLIPLIEMFVPASAHNDKEEELKVKSGKKFFDWLLYLNVPFVYGLVGFFIWLLQHRDWSTAELVFSVINVGILLGVAGINVAHELGHRQNMFARWMARLLLVPAMYSHYTLEHNYGHHLQVGTPEDPATARKNQPIYFFFVRSSILSYLNAWKIERRMLQSKGKPWWHNEIIWGHVAQLTLLAFIFRIAGWEGTLLYLCAALIGILALESVNYIEHYGLVRKKLASGRYEPMAEAHSWNSNHELGRIVLFELVRHADHHYQTTRKYQTLRHLDKSPQLPFGYPMSIIIALIPPLWFWMMNKRADAANARPVHRPQTAAS